MKKRILACVLCMCMVMVAITGCAAKKTKDVNKLSKIVFKDVEKYATPGDFLGMNIEVSTSTEVTDEDFDAYIQELLAAYPMQVDTGIAEMDHKININYAGRVDGEEFEGGTSEDVDITLGEGGFIEGFEEQIVGMSVGDKKTIQVTFPEEYSNSPELAGKPAEFDITLNHLYTASEFTEDWIHSLEDGMFKDYTLDSFKEFLLNNMKSSLEASRKEEVQTQISTALIDNTTFKDIPKKMKTDFLESYKKNVDEALSSQGASKKDYLDDQGIDEATFDKQLEEQSLEYLKYLLAVKAIALKAKIEFKQKDYDSWLEQYATDVGIDSVDDLVDQYGGNKGEELFEYFVSDKVIEYLTENAKVVDAQATEAPATEAPATEAPAAE